MNMPNPLSARFESSEVAQEISVKGIAELPGLFDGDAAGRLLAEIYRTRRFDASLFIAEEEWNGGNKSHKHTNPGSGNNLLEKLQDKLGFVEENDRFRELLASLLGPGYRIYLKKLVCRLPRNAIPGWVWKLFEDQPVSVLGAFIKPEYRDISYYYDVDAHQDILEWPRQPQDQKEHRLLYCYVHLGEVTYDNSPLIFFSGSHKLGATPYQHDIRQASEASGEWMYRDPATGKSMKTRLFHLTGGAGHAAIWHPCLVHGSHPSRTDTPRLALRYVLARDPAASHCLLDDINAGMEGLPYLETNYNPGAVTNPNGIYSLLHNDFTRLGRKGT